eukprot:6178290-Pleurochrysis_carterae.AAC.3
MITDLPSASLLLAAVALRAVEHTASATARATTPPAVGASACSRRAACTAARATAGGGGATAGADDLARAESLPQVRSRHAALGTPLPSRPLGVGRRHRRLARRRSRAAKRTHTLTHSRTPTLKHIQTQPA